MMMNLNEAAIDISALEAMVDRLKAEIHLASKEADLVKRRVQAVEKILNTELFEAKLREAEAGRRDAEWRIEHAIKALSGERCDE